MQEALFYGFSLERHVADTRQPQLWRSDGIPTTPRSAGFYAAAISFRTSKPPCLCQLASLMTGVRKGPPARFRSLSLQRSSGHKPGESLARPIAAATSASLASKVIP
jgi:hypothetical protein